MPDVDAFNRVLAEQSNDVKRYLVATGMADEAAVTLVAKLFQQIRLRDATLDTDTNSWYAPLRLRPSASPYELNVTVADNAQPPVETTAPPDPFTLARRNSANVTLTMDDEGQVTRRSWADGRQQNLTWDAAGRLTQVIEFKVPLAVDSEAAYAFRWSAVYDGLGRRCVTRTEWGAWSAGGFTADAERAVVLEESWFDPLVEFLEIVTEVRELGNPAATRRSWRVHGPDANGSYGGLQGLGGLEAVYSHGAAAVASGSWSGVIDDYYGHVIATVEGPALEENGLGGERGLAADAEFGLRPCPGQSGVDAE